MQPTPLHLPPHQVKPRTAGLTMVIDSGLPTRQFADTMASFNTLIDVVKFGWGTSVVTEDLKYKIDALREQHIDFYFGGTLFETFVSQDAFDDWRRYVDMFGCHTVEVSNGTIALSNEDKATYVARLAGDYRVYSEVGFKDPVRSENLRPGKWIDYIRQDLAAGAYKVITESRESGKSGICRPNGELRLGLIEEIAESGIAMTDIMFEAPNKDLQIAMIRRFGSEVNLGNVAPSDIIGLETLRLGLRGDTLLDFAAPEVAEHFAQPAVAGA